MSIILHIAERHAWEQARSAPGYRPPSLEQEGFIHCSTPAQAVEVANALFVDQAGLVLLVIDSSRLTSELVYEDLTGSGQSFPHVYGPFNQEAVFDVLPFPAGADGRFRLPDRLVTTLDAPILRLDEMAELRLLEPHHAASLFALVDANRRYLRRWLPWLDQNQSLDDSRRFIDSVQKQFRRSEGLQTGLWVNGRLAGVAGFNRLDFVNRCGSLGYWLAASEQGRGLMTGACRALIQHGFENLELNRIEILCATSNRRSCAIPHRLGFTHEGVLRQAEWLYDHYVDHNVYSLLASDWHDQVAHSS